MDTALRLLEYQDFTEAPFMQDMHTRALYDSLKGQGSRQNFMEEFLVALGVKKPIRLMVEEDKKVYDNPGRRLEDFIVIRSDTWGYIYLEASADGDFIHLPRLISRMEPCGFLLIFCRNASMWGKITERF